MLKKLGVYKDFKDESLKSVFVADDKKIIEMTLLNNKESMDVVCVPTHHFCNLGCKMCHLTNKGLNKQMLPIGEKDFLEALYATLVDKNNKRRTNKEKLLISFMGVGEPLLNLELIERVYMNEKQIKEKLHYKEISYALSTMMPNDNLIKFSDIVNELCIPLKVHFSLHTPIDADRKELIPSTKLNINEALNYLCYYRNIVRSNVKIMEKYILFHRTDDPIEIHYTLIEGVNDKDQELEELCKLLNQYKITVKFIRFNPINELRGSINEEKWLKVLQKKCPNIRIKTYSPPGREIGSSCGEFTKHYYHEEIETENQQIEFLYWEKKHRVE